MSARLGVDFLILECDLVLIQIYPNHSFSPYNCATAKTPSDQDVPQIRSLRVGHWPHEREGYPSEGAHRLGVWLWEWAVG